MSRTYPWRDRRPGARGDPKPTIVTSRRDPAEMEALKKFLVKSLNPPLFAIF
jgi:hypothetical protein